MFHRAASTNKTIKENHQRFFRVMRTPVLLSACCFMFASCAHIEVQPKDSGLLKLEDFAKKVAMHIYDEDANTYLANFVLIQKEVTPGVLTELQKRSLVPKSDAEAKATMKAMKKGSAEGGAKIEQSDFSGKATAQGLVPIEVKGVKGSPKQSKAQKFDVIFLVGFKPNSTEPIVGAVQFK